MANGHDILKISILINNYNYAQYLNKSIESSLNQSYANIQVLAVDDGSDDGSDDIAKSYSKDNYIYIRKENGGQNSAIRAALPYLTGDYTIILDSDDWLRRDACEIIARAAQKNSANAVMYQLKKINLAGAEIGNYPEAPFLKVNNREFVLKYGYIPCPPTSGIAYKTDFLINSFNFVSKESFYSDGYLAAAAAYTNKVIYIDDFLGFYLVHGANASLSAGYDSQKLFKNNNYALDHAKNLYAWLSTTPDKPASWHDLIREYSWRYIVQFKLRDNSYKEFSWLDCMYYGVKKFTIAHHYGFSKQIKNISYIILFSIYGIFIEKTRLKR